MKKYLSKGFTLVELLIVIALLGVIATIVIAAINPIEQAARARDAGYKADASQLLSAIDRYYASHNKYPWNDCTGDGCAPAVLTTDAGVNFVFADTAGYGLCTVTGKACKSQTVQGTLVAALELQTAFLNKTWIGASDTTDWSSALVIAKGTTASSAVYVCWEPQSNSNKQNLMSNKKVLTKSFKGDAPDAGSCSAVGDAGWKNGDCLECVPE